MCVRMHARDVVFGFLVLWISTSATETPLICDIYMCV